VRVAALYDVHGNLPALEAVLEEAADYRPDLIIFGGDVASGLLPVETLDLLMTLEDVRFVRGNADRALVEMYDQERKSDGLADEWVVAQITPRHRDFLDAFETKVVADGTLYCHATPHDDEPIFTRLSLDERVRRLIGYVEHDLVVCGHTHMQFDRTVYGIRVVNAGSVGMPYGTTEACWALVEDGEVDLRRTWYDLEAAAERLRRSGHSQAKTLVAENVLTSPSEEEAIGFFEELAARPDAP